MGSLRGWTPQPLPLSPTIPSLFLLLHIWPSSSPSYDAAKRNPPIEWKPKISAQNQINSNQCKNTRRKARLLTEINE